MIQHPSEKIFYLVRHGQVAFPDQQRRYLGRTDLPLSQRGLTQADWLRQYFQPFISQKRLTAVYHSPLQRCSKTAEVLAQKQIPCLAVTALQEIAMGQWELLSMEQIKQQQPALYEQRGQCFASFCPPGGESFLQCQQRSVLALQQIADSQLEGTACVLVTHAGVIRCLLSWATQQPLQQMFSFQVPYGSITALILQGAEWRIGPQITNQIKNEA